LTNEFLDFLDQTPSPWHVAAVSKKKLLQSGFVELKESQDWNIKPNMKFFFQREALTAAFVVGSDWKPGNEFCPGFKIRGAVERDFQLRSAPSIFSFTA